MCGIWGIMKKNSMVSANDLVYSKLAAQKMHHRGPDDDGYWNNNHFALSFKRLSILDLSSLGNQPMISQCENYVLVYNGELYNHRDIRETLENKGYQVVLFDAKPSKYKSKDQIEHIGDILSFKDISLAMDGCSSVYHFAAQADIGASSKIPTDTIMSNIIGTQNVLEAAIKNKLERFVFSSTIYVYSNLGSFYRVSKQASEKIVEEYHREFGLDYTILRYGSLYGPRSNEFNFISNALLQALKEKKIVRRGDGEEIREYIHVKDAARLSVDALNEKYINQHLIITGNQQIRVKDLLVMIREIFNGEIEIKMDGEEDLHHYEITPYSFRPEIARKISPDNYYDLGQGIMDLIYELKKELDNKDGKKKVSLRKRKK